MRERQHDSVELSVLVPIGAALVGAAALLLAADLLTVKGRLRRKLDKELVIKERLTAGTRERRDLDELVRRHALELFHRERRENGAPLALVVLSVVGIAISVGNWVYLARNPDVPPDPDPFNRYVLPWFPVVFLPSAVAVMSSQRNKREAYVDEATAAPVSWPMPTRRLPITTRTTRTRRPRT